MVLSLETYAADLVHANYYTLDILNEVDKAPILRMHTQEEQYSLLCLSHHFSGCSWSQACVISLFGGTGKLGITGFSLGVNDED